MTQNQSSLAGAVNNDASDPLIACILFVAGHFGQNFHRAALSALARDEQGNLPFHQAAPLLASLAPAEREGCRAAAAQGLVMMQADELDAADTLLLGRTAGCGDDPVFWRALGRLHLTRDRAGAAADAFGEALTLQPGNDSIRNDLAVAMIAAGRPAEAAPILSDLARRIPGQPETVINLDYANGMMGRTPSRRESDNDAFWSQRLQYAGYGALSAGKAALGEALLGQALIERPRYDAQLWRQYSEVSGKR